MSSPNESSVRTVFERAHDTDVVLAEVRAERIRQHEKWGEQNHADGTGPLVMWSCPGFAQDISDFYRWKAKSLAGKGRVTYLDILLEEVAEAFAEIDPARLRAELVQVAAVAVQWIEAIDRRRADKASHEIEVVDEHDDDICGADGPRVCRDCLGYEGEVEAP